jgi:hypothetical protein
MGADRDLTRRAVVCGFAGALALLFLPLDRFVGGLAEMWARIFEAPGPKIYSFKDLTITFNGITLKGYDLLHEGGWEIVDGHDRVAAFETEMEMSLQDFSAMLATLQRA